MRLRKFREGLPKDSELGQPGRVALQLSLAGLAIGIVDIILGANGVSLGSAVFVIGAGSVFTGILLIAIAVGDSHQT